MDTSSGVSKWGCRGDITFPWWVHGNLHWRHWVGMHPKVLGARAPPSASPSEDVPEGGRRMGAPIGVTKWRRAQGRWVRGYLHQHHQAEMDPRVVGSQTPLPASLLGLTLGAHGLRDAAGVTEPVGVDRPHQEEVDGVGDEAAHRVGLTLHVGRHRLPRTTRRLAARVQG